MSKLIVEVCEIKDIIPHPNADNLEISIIKGWQTVTPRGKYHIGEKVIFIPPDALLPIPLVERLGIKSYLSGPGNNKVKAVRLRGEMSFGLVMSLPEGSQWDIGYDCSNDLGITKYIPPIRLSLGDDAGYDPLFFTYTDIENIRNFPDMFENGEMVVATEKIDGTNCRIGIGRVEDGDFEWKAGSHRVKRKKTNDLSDNVYWYPYTLENFKRMIEDIHQSEKKEVICYGEVYGRVRGGHKSMHYGKPNNLNFVAFDIQLDGKYIDYCDFARYCDLYQVPRAPLLDIFEFDFNAAKNLSTGKSVLALKNGIEHMREGSVIKPIKERQSPKGNRVIAKFINADYVDLKEKSYSKGDIADYTDN